MGDGSGSSGTYLVSLRGAVLDVVAELLGVVGVSGTVARHVENGV
jgi:hypothetical protein